MSLVITAGIETVRYAGTKYYEVVDTYYRNFEDFKRMYMSHIKQEIISKEEDNSLIISFQASHAEDVDNLIKSWLPHIAILEPKWLKDQLLEELGAYLLQQNS